MCCNTNNNFCFYFSTGKQESEEAEEFDIDSVSDGEEVDENVILSRLRNQAKILQELGGEVPDEIKELIDQPYDNSTDGGKEIPVTTEPTSFSLIAGYGDDSEPEEEGGKSEEKQTETPKPLFPIVESETKDRAATKSLNLKVIKLSARAKALINASTTTAKARATDFVSTAEGLRPADVVAASEKCMYVNLQNFFICVICCSIKNESDWHKFDLFKSNSF